MFDFRYHALSLIAVLVALVLGLLLGVAIGDKGLVSSAENKIKESLRKDVRSEQKKVADLNDQLTAKDKFEQLGMTPLGELCYTTPAVANGRMYIRTHSHLISLGGK